MEWASVSLFGKGQWQLHIVSALIGVLSVIMVYFVTYRLFLMGGKEDEDFEFRRRRAKIIALLAMFLMAVSSWYVVLSRTALRANLTPLFGSLTLYFFLRTYQSQTKKTKMWFAALTGAAFALGFYTYIAYRIMAPILLMITLWPLLATIKYHQFKQTVRDYWKLAVLCAIMFVIVVFPIADYFYHNFDFFIGRSGQVSIFNQTLYTVDGQQLSSRPPLGVVVSVLGEVTKTAVLGFFTHGDLNWRQNISGYPLVSPLVSPFFGVGLIVISLFGIWYFFAPNKRSGYWKYYVLTGWFWGMLIPEISTAESIPHGLRSAGTIPPVFIISAVAIYYFCFYLYKLHLRLHTNWPRGQRLVRAAFLTLCACFVVALTLQTYFLYFVYAANSPEYFYSFRADLTPVSEYLVSRCEDSLAAGQGSTKSTTFLVLDPYSVQTTDFLTSNAKGNFNDPCNVPYQDVDPASSWQLPPLKSGQAVVFTESTIFDTQKFTQHHPEAYLTLSTRNQFGEVVLAVYEAK